MTVDLHPAIGESILISGYIDRHHEFVTYRMDTKITKNETEQEKLFIVHIHLLQFDFPKCCIHVFIRNGLSFEYDRVKLWVEHFQMIRVYDIAHNEYTYRMFMEAGGNPNDDVGYVHSFLKHCAIKSSSICLFLP